MTQYSTSEFKPGLKIMVEQAPHVILDQAFVNPGKGQAFYRLKLRNLINQKLIDKTFKSGEVLKAAEIEDRSGTYLYHDDSNYYFMDAENFDQLEVPLRIVEDHKVWFSEGEEICQITVWEGRPISCFPPQILERTVRETVPGVKGDTANGGSKICTLENGVKLRTPLFIEAGNRLKVDTRTNQYIARVHH